MTNRPIPIFILHFKSKITDDEQKESFISREIAEQEYFSLLNNDYEDVFIENSYLH